MNWQATVEKTVAGLGYELVECERGSQGLLRVTIDLLPGAAGAAVTVDDCEKVTRQLQYVLEVEGCDYKRLEVSSPGLDRPLKTAAHYARFAGERVEITLKLPFQGRKKYAGLLMPGEGEGGAWALQLVAPEPMPGSKAARAAKKRVQPAAAESAPVQVLNFTLDEVREARLVPVVDFKGRRGSVETAPAVQESGGHEE
ncbi:MAG TPA: ribosome maturation factor RimP [Methylibium sp.]|nr:ribosome maturation factor RimP [Methylibium sp.]